MRSRKRNAASSVIGALVVLGAAFFIWRAVAATTIPPGYDSFNTPANGETAETLSLPAGALTDSAGSPSQAFSGPITFEGGPPVNGFTGDTVIERTQAVTPPGSTPLQVIGLNLVSVGAIQITFADGTSANYAVAVAQSPSTRSTGLMSFSVGGTFTSTLSINVLYTLTASGEPTVNYDAAPNGIPAIAFSASGTWSVSGTTVTITPQTEQSQLASHNILPAPKKTATPISPLIDDDKKAGR